MDQPNTKDNTMRLPKTEAELVQLIAAARAKLEELRHERHRSMTEYSTQLVKRAERGMVLLLAHEPPDRLWISAGGKKRAARLPHKLSAGAMLEVVAVQPRAGRIWGSDGTDAYCFETHAERNLIDVYPNELAAQVAFAAKRGDVFERTPG